MALRFESEASSLVGIQWRIRIYDNEYGGSTVIPFKVGGDIFELTYDGADDDRVQYIIPSELSFTFIVTSPIDEELIDELRGSKEARYMVEVSYLETTYKPYWRGIIFSNQLQVVDEYYPQQVRITCSDDIKALDSIPYKVDEDTPYTGTATIASHLINCINKVRWISLNSSTRLTWEDFFFSSEQFATYGTALSNIALVHEALRETSDNGAINYRSTYEILHEILSLFGLRMFQVNGAFMCQSIFAAEADPANAEQGFLNNVEVTDTDTVARPTFSFGANYVRERGWTNGYLHPYNEVQRKYNFAGGFNFGRIENFPHNGYNGSNFANLSSQILSAAENVYEEGVAPALTFKFDYWIQEGTNWDLSEQVGLLRLSMTLNVGGYYLNRNMNVSALTTIPFYTYNDGDVNVPVASYGETTWVQNSSSRYRMFIAHEDMNWDHTRSHTLTITCPPLPADLAQSSVVQIGFQLDVYDPQATLTNNSSYIAQFGNMRVTQLALLPSIGGPIDGSTVRYRVINEDANNRSVLELPETYVGDKMVDGINHVLKAYDGNLTPPWVSTETWYTLENSTPIYPVHKLQCYEILTGQNRIVPTQFGVLHERPSTTVPGLRMHSLLNAGSGVYWGIFNFTLSAYANSYDISLWRLDRDVSDIQVPNDDYTHPIDNGTPGTGISNDTGPTEDIRVRNLQIGDAFKEISDTAATVSGLSVRVERIYDTFQPLDDDTHNVTKIVHQANASTGMSVTLEEGTAQITSNSGNTYWSLGESSPGQMRVFVQDDATPTPNSVGAMFITAASNVGKVGINTSTPDEAMHVVGNSKVQGNIIVSGTVDGVDISALKTTVDGLSGGGSSTGAEYWAFYLAD